MEGPAAKCNKKTTEAWRSRSSTETFESFKNPCVLGALLCLCGKINNESMEVRRIHGGVRKISFQLSG